MFVCRGRIRSYLSSGIVTVHFTNDVVARPLNHTREQARSTNGSPVFSTQTHRDLFYTKKVLCRCLTRRGWGARDAKRDFPVPLSPSISALVCPPTADGLGRPASAASDDAATTNGSTARQPGCSARQASPTSGSSSSLTRS